MVWNTVNCIFFKLIVFSSLFSADVAISGLVDLGCARVPYDWHGIWNWAQIFTICSHPAKQQQTCDICTRTTFWKTLPTYHKHELNFVRQWWRCQQKVEIYRMIRYHLSNSYRIKTVCTKNDPHTAQDQYKLSEKSLHIGLNWNFCGEQLNAFSINYNNN